MAIGLFTTRIVLYTLGETDYGIYTLVAGVVGMLGVLQGSMSNASMRYMAYSLGSGDENLILRTFNTTLFIHILIGLAVFAFIEIGGYFLFEYVLNIPEEKIFDAKVVFHFMALTTFITIIAVPYDAVINSHENLLALSVVDIIGAALRLTLAIYLTYTDLNLLILYGAGLFLVQVIMRIIKKQYSNKHYKECRINFKEAFDKDLSKEIMSFSGWSFIESLSAMSITQLRNVLLNMFFGVNVNASAGISKKATSQINQVSINLTRAIKPQIIKSEGGGDRQRMLHLTTISTKFSVFLFSLLMIPAIIELPFLFNLWLKDVPEFAVVFTRLALIGTLMSRFSFEINNAIKAAGRIRRYTLINSIVIIMNAPAAYFLFKYNYPPQTIYTVWIFFAIILFFLRLYLGNRIIQLDVKNFINKGVVPILIPLIITSLMAFIPFILMTEGALRFFIVLLISTTLLISLFNFIGLNTREKKKLKNIFLSFIGKFKRILK